jgi:hypothetical protein
MVGWGDVSVGAGMINGGLQRMGIRGTVHVALESDDGEQLEAAFSKQAVFADMTLPSGVWRTCTQSGVYFRWPKR